MNKAVAPIYDADAQAYLTATEITDVTISNSWNNYVVNLKIKGIWIKLKCLYPMIGGTAFTHKFNGKDPRDLDSAYRLTFSKTGLIHSYTGIKANGTSGYADTNYKSLTNNLALGFYSGVEITDGDKIEMGCFRNPPVEDISIAIKYTGNLFYAIIGSRVYPNTSNSSSRGNFIANNLANVITGFKNITKVIPATNNSNAIPTTISISLFSQKNETGNFTRFSDTECRNSFISEGLTEQQAIDFATLTEKFQFDLGRSALA
jgi:hypothetical protein